MSDYHILDGDLDGGALQYTVVFHIPVPDEANTVGTNLQSAIAQDPDVPSTSIVPWISQQEETAIGSGEIYEYVTHYARKTSNTLVQDRDALDAVYAARLPIIQNKIRDKYKFWGYSRDVP